MCIMWSTWGKAKARHLKAAESNQRTECGGQRSVFQLLLMLITTCGELQVLLLFIKHNAYNSVGMGTASVATGIFIIYLIS